jgi:osmotically-inducible protein OsmY
MKKMKIIICAFMLAGFFAAGAADMQVSDNEVANAVESEIRFDDVIRANSIDVTVLDGVVTLKGVVRNIYAKERLTELASALVGVRAVVNLVQVTPLVDLSDEQIQVAVEDALRNDPVADSYEINVAVTNGTVTLSGTVESYAEFLLSEQVAKTVSGVSEVQNEIQINFATERLDSEIKMEVEERLKNDVRVDDFLIDVRAEQGRVILSGIVGSLQEKSQAHLCGWVSGVKDVNVDDLKIRWWARNEVQRKDWTTARTDEEIEDAVKSAFLYDPRVRAFNPEVEVENGTVWLRGVVTDALAREAAGQDARNTAGVVYVRNNLKVRANVPGNAELKERVEKALADADLLSGQNLEVSVNDGWVMLSGDVKTSFEKIQAERIALRIPGTAGVINRIQFDRHWLWKPDRDLQREVEEQLFWSALVDAENVTVSVDNGVVTLSGQVSSWGEYDDAENNAYQAGAKTVKNELDVDTPYLYGPVGPTFITGYPGPGVYPYSIFYY